MKMLKGDLQREYEIILNGLSEKERRALHLNSVGNFILYFDKLDEKYQLEVGNLLQDYFNAIKEDDKVHGGKEIDSFHYEREHLSKIGRIYVDQLDFSFESTLTVTIFIGVICILFAVWINSIILSVIVVGFIVWEGLDDYRNIKKKKYYKVGW